MTEPDPADDFDANVLAQAEQLNDGLRRISDIMLGGVRTLVTEGWTEEQARQIVLRTYLGGGK